MKLKPLEILVYQDVLCAWCYVAERRLETLRQELGSLVRWRSRPYALRLEESVPSDRERSKFAEEVHHARKEPEGAQLVPDLWIGADFPSSSVPALAALEAAKLQGSSAQQALTQALRSAALEQGINVSRSDVLFELAARVGLEMNRFSAAFLAPQTRRLIREEFRLAKSRGVTGAPTLVIGGRWMVCGLKETPEYRAHILDCLKKTAQQSSGDRGQLLQ